MTRDLVISRKLKSQKPFTLNFQNGGLVTIPGVKNLHPLLETKARPSLSQDSFNAT